MSELSFRGFPSFHYLCRGHETNNSICCFSPIWSRLSFPASFVFASSSTFCCHTSGFEQGPTSWIWSLAAVCCQCFPTEDRDGIQKARGNGGQAGNIHSRWRLRQSNIYKNNVLILSFHSALWVSDSSACLSYPLLYYFRKCGFPPLPPLPLNKLLLDTDLYSRLCYPYGSLGAHPNRHSRKGALGEKTMTHPAQTVRMETSLSFVQWQMPTRCRLRIQSVQLLLHA